VTTSFKSKVKITRINGLKIISLSLPRASEATIKLVFNAGSNFESPKKKGIAHALEHVLTEGQYEGGYNSINNYFNNMGADFAAGTTPEHIFLDVSCNPRDAGKCVENFLLKSFCPTFDIAAEKFHAMKKVLCEEVRSDRSEQLQIFIEMIKRASFGLKKGSPVGVYGTIKDQKVITLEKIKEFHRQHFFPQNACLIVTGNFDRKVIEEKVSRFFAQHKDIPKRSNPKNFIKWLYQKRLPQKPVFIKSQRHYVCCEMYLDFGIPSEANGDTHPFITILSRILENRIYGTLRSRGLLYNLPESFETTSDVSTGLFYNYGINHQKAGIAAEVIVQQIKDLKKNGPTVEELNVNKNYIIKSQSRIRGDSDRQAESLRNNLHELPYLRSEDEKAQMLKSLTRTQLRSVARRILSRKNLVAACSATPYQDKVLRCLTRI
jgi:predicted Zn-dependent peptidase